MTKCRDGCCQIFWGGPCVCAQSSNEVFGPNPARALAILMAMSGEVVDQSSVETAADYCDQLVPWPPQQGTV